MLHGIFTHLFALIPRCSFQLNGQIEYNSTATSMTMRPLSVYQFAVAEGLQPVAETALERLRYFHPDWMLRIEASTIIADVHNTQYQEAAREIRYALYREKILTETMDMRRELLRMVARS